MTSYLNILIKKHKMFTWKDRNSGRINNQRGFDITKGRKLIFGSTKQASGFVIGWSHSEEAAKQRSPEEQPASSRLLFIQTKKMNGCGSFNKKSFLLFFFVFNVKN